MQTVVLRVQTEAGGKRTISNHQDQKDTKRSMCGVYNQVSKYPALPWPEKQIENSQETCSVKDTK